MFRPMSARLYQYDDEEGQTLGVSVLPSIFIFST